MGGVPFGKRPASLFASFAEGLESQDKVYRDVRIFRGVTGRFWYMSAGMFGNLQMQRLHAFYPRCICTKFQNHDVMKLLIEHQAAINVRGVFLPPLHFAAITNDPEAGSAVFKADQRKRALSFPQRRPELGVFYSTQAQARQFGSFAAVVVTLPSSACILTSVPSFLSFGPPPGLQPSR